MEIIIALVVIGVAGWFFFIRDPKKGNTSSVAPAAPYKVETPEPAPAPVVEEVKVEEPVVEAPAKKPRKPRAPKVEAKTVAKKAAVKKAASKPAVRTAKSKKA